MMQTPDVAARECMSAVLRAIPLLIHMDRGPHLYRVKVGACADYLLGQISLEAIAMKWHLPNKNIITKWIKQRGCFKLRRARKVAVVLAGVLALGVAEGRTETCIASHYGRGDGYHGGRVACRGLGPFNTYATAPYTVAHRTRPCGSYVQVTNLANGKSLRAMVTDRGPFIRGRCVDLGYAGAKALGMGGTARVSVE